MFGPRYESVELELDESSPIPKRKVKRKRNFDPRSPITFCLITTITFILALSYLIDFKDDNNPLSRTIHEMNFLSMPSLTWKYQHESSKRKGVMILSAPSSRAPLLTSYLSEAGFRLSSSSEEDDSIILQYDPEGPSAPGTFFGMEPFQRLDSFHENDIILTSQEMKWYSSDINKFNSTMAKAQIREDGFLEKSNIFTLLEGAEDDKKPWIWQDAQLCATLPVWIDAIQQETPNLGEEETKIAVIFSYRHPLDMAKALHDSFPLIPIVQGLQLWLKYNYKCLSNLKFQKNICPVFTSALSVSSQPQKEIKRILMELDEKCQVAPGPPGKLGPWSAYYQKQEIRIYENRQHLLGKDHKSYREEASDDVLDALGLKNLQTGCDYNLAEHDEDESEPEWEWGSEAVTAAMNEIENKMLGNAEMKEKARDERKRIEQELQNEIHRWMGEDASDGFHQILDLEKDNLYFDAKNVDWIKEERMSFMSSLKKEVSWSLADAMQVYCDFRNGDAFEDEYNWPEMF